MQRPTKRIVAVPTIGRIVLPAALLVALAAAATLGHAESSVGNPESGRASSAARLTFKIVIPSVVVRDVNTGAWRSNDRRLQLVAGTFARTSGGPVTGDPQSLPVASMGATRDAVNVIGAAFVLPIATASTAAHGALPEGDTSGANAAVVQCAP